jgi:Sec-independent protein translocase protein TatA
LLPEAVKQAGNWMKERRKEFEDVINDKLNAHLKALDRLREKQYGQLEFRFMESRLPQSIVEDRKAKERRRIDQVFDEFLDWVQDTMTTEETPYLQVVAVLRGTD